MARRIFNVAAFVSTALLACTLLPWFATSAFDPVQNHISLTRTFHIGFRPGLNGDTIGRFVVFNDAEEGPYRGSVYQLSDGNGNIHRHLVRKVAWGDSFGIYYRYFRWPEGTTLWTLMVSLWYPLVLFAGLPLAWLFTRCRARRVVPVNAPHDSAQRS
jgi:hypothetical protein